MSATAFTPVKLNQTKLKITTQSVEVNSPLYSAVVEYVQALNDLYEISRFIADPKYDEFRNQMRNHISGKYEELLRKIWREPTPEADGDMYFPRLSERQSGIAADVSRFMESDSLDLNNLFYLDETYLKSLMRLNEEDKLRVSRISLSSPLEISTIVTAVPAAIAAVWGIVQILDKLANIKKVKLEMQKLQRELAEPAASSKPKEIEGDTEFAWRLSKATPYEKAKYLQRTRVVRETLIKVQEIQIEVIEVE